MLALRKLASAAGISLAEVSEPHPAPDEVLIRVQAAGICGSDLHVDDWTGSYHFIGPALPVTLGHEFSGRVVDRGAEAGGFAIGQSVVVVPSVTCGRCSHCLTGDRDGCTDRRGIGMTRNGAFALLVAVPERNCIALPETVDPAVAALAEPLTVSLQAVRRGGVGSGARVLVLGPGTIGQGIALMARRAGAAEIVVCGFNDRPRLRTVRALGFEATLDLAEPPAEGRLEALARSGFDVVIEATGAPRTIQSGPDRLRPGGVFVATGIREIEGALRRGLRLI